MREYVDFPMYLQQNQNDELLRPIPAISESNAHVRVRTLFKDFDLCFDLQFTACL